MAFKNLLLALLPSLMLAAPGATQERSKAARKIVDSAPCNEFAPAAKTVMGKSVGIEQCQIISEETVFNIKGQKFRRVEILLTGTVEGWASLEKGSRAIYFTDGPDFVFPQSGLNGPRGHGIGRFEGATGHGLTIFYPEDARQWNGKLFMTAHGAGSYASIGSLVARDPKAKFNGLQDVNRYVTLMIDKGYAVAHTMRSADRSRGDVTVTLEDGSVLKNYNLSSHAGLLTSWTQLARNFIGKRVGAAPKRIYFYGHSAGGFWGRQVNYQPGANVDAGRPLIDGFLLDDAGSGLWLPKLMVNNQDVLFAANEERQRFAKQIDTTHMLYSGDTGDYLANKRENARMLRAKGLGDKHRLYEFRGVSHFDAGQNSRLDLVSQTLDLTGLFDALIDRLDAWVDMDVAPPPTKSDLVELGGAGKNGVDANPAIALPEVACPLGVYYVYPPGVDPGRRGGQETAFARFDGVNQEPLDARGELVDMNGNGKRDRRETTEQAWQRLGLLKSGQALTSAAYQKCVSDAAGVLVRQKLLPKSVGEYYVEQAGKRSLAN
jgi:alpha/beta hydrolase family protein